MRTGCALLALVLASVAAAGEGPKLVDEARILSNLDRVDDRGWRACVRGPYDVQLSPDGTKLLYLESRNQKVGGQDRTVRRPVVRDLASKQVIVLAVPMATSDDVFAYLFTSRLFDPAGRRLVLGVGIDADGDGVTSPGMQDGMQAAMCDIATGKATLLDLRGPAVLPSFGRTGKHVFALSYDVKKDTGTLYRADAERLAFQPLKLLGLPRTVCPAADVMTMLVKPAKEKKTGYGLVLFDTKAGRRILDVPTQGYNWNLIKYPPRWTPDGRYLYVYDHTPYPAKYHSAIWDRETTKLLGRVDTMYPLGPGPTRTTMVLGKVMAGSKRGMILHDAATDKRWDLAGRNVRPVTAAGGRVFYVKWTDDGNALFSARIAMPNVRN